MGDFWKSRISETITTTQTLTTTSTTTTTTIGTPATPGGILLPINFQGILTGFGPQTGEPGNNSVGLTDQVNNIILNAYKNQLDAERKYYESSIKMKFMKKDHHRSVEQLKNQIDDQKISIEFEKNQNSKMIKAILAHLQKS